MMSSRPQGNSGTAHLAQAGVVLMNRLPPRPLCRSLSLCLLLPHPFVAISVDGDTRLSNLWNLTFRSALCVLYTHKNTTINFSVCVLYVSVFELIRSGKIVLMKPKGLSYLTHIHTHTHRHTHNPWRAFSLPCCASVLPLTTVTPLLLGSGRWKEATGSRALIQYEVHDLTSLWWNWSSSVFNNTGSQKTFFIF